MKQNARFSIEGYDAFILVGTNEKFTTIYYVNEEFKEAPIAKKYIPYFELN